MKDNIYINSLEGSEIWEYMYRGRELRMNFVGMLPYSLQLIKLKKLHIKTQESKQYNKILTRDIINVKFNSKIKSTDKVIELLNKKINEDNKDRVEAYIDKLKNIDSTHSKEIKVDKLRKELYKNGFTITYEDGTSIDYVVYSRSSAKSRTGQVLFINKKFKDEMMNWQRMGLKFEGRTDIDFPSLLSYESLVGSSIEDIISIDVDKILVVSDVKSIFEANVNVVKKDSNGLLVSEKSKDTYKMESDIFDGEGLLDIAYFQKANREDKGMMLLRNHMFKSCVFNTNIQEFLREYCPKEQDYDTWKLEGLFKTEILAKDVAMITTPNSLKFLKFHNVKKSEKVKDSKEAIFNHWKKVVKKEGDLFGICKSEKPSKRGHDENGNIVNQTSYQILNSMPINYEDIEMLSDFELSYIQQLKNDNNVYIEYLIENANDINSNSMLVDLYKRNTNIANTELFRTKRTKDISNYVEYIKKGKIRLNGDYCTIMQNGKELLYHAIGKLPVKNGVLDYETWEDEMILKNNEVYTTLHPFNKEYVGCRSPHTSPSNVLIVENKDSEFIKKYFNLNDNIIYTNAIGFEINRILGGQDVDSDQLILFNNKYLLKNAKECYKKYRVCVNNVDLADTNEYNKYVVSNKDMAKIDNTLAESQKNIGEVVNTGQLYMSAYWDYKNKNGEDIYKYNKLIEGIDICTVLSEISIDMAKRMYDIDIKKQIRELKKSKHLGEKKPLFFKYVSDSKNIKNNIQKYETPMDYLQDIFSKLEVAQGNDNINLDSLALDIKAEVKSKQIEGLLSILKNMNTEQRKVYVEYKNKNLTEDDEIEKYNKLDNITKEHMFKVKKYKIRKETVVYLINNVFRDRIKCNNKIDLLNALYKANKETFLESFKEN